MTKKVVVRVAARGYVDGRYIGEEKEVIESVDPSGRGKHGRKPAGAGRGGKSRGSNTAGDDRGNRVSRGRGASAGNANANAGRRRPQAGAAVGVAGERAGRKSRGVRGERSGRASTGADQTSVLASGANGNVDPAFANRGGNQTRAPRGAGRSGSNERNDRNNHSDRNTKNGSKSQRRGTPRVPGAVDAIGTSMGIGNTFANDNIGNGIPGANTPRARRNRGGKKTPFRTASSTQSLQGGVGARALISEVAETRRWGDESKSGQFADALAKEVNIKRERLHKVLAQSGYGSRRDMEIMITSGRVMVNGIVATTGTSVSANDAVMIDQRLVKIKFNEELPRLILYHKPDGEIVTTNDPGNRITVFDNLPRVENGKWMSIGRLDINTSGLLIFTTNGELANRLMHPRYEVEREYAVRVLGQLTEEQTAKLLSGVSIAMEAANDDEDDGVTDVAAEDRPAKFDSIEARGGDGANQWYHVVLREGRNREVRKMFESVGLTVSRLIRVRFGKIGLPPRLTRGRMMELDDSQVRAVLRWVGMEVDGHIGALPTNHQPHRGQRPERNARQDQTDDKTPQQPSDVDGAVNESQPSNVGGSQQPRPRGERNEVRRGRGLRSRHGERRNTNVKPTESIEGVDFVAGDLAIKDFQAAQGLATEVNPSAPAAALTAPNTNDRPPRRGRSRTMRRPRGPNDFRGARESRVERTDATTPLPITNDNAGNHEPSREFSPSVDSRDIDDSIGNRINSAPVDRTTDGIRSEKPAGRRGAGRNRGADVPMVEGSSADNANLIAAKKPRAPSPPRSPRVPRATNDTVTATASVNQTNDDDNSGNR
jgi:23S rRNA pseudouridine2605 synthase